MTRYILKCNTSKDVLFGRTFEKENVGSPDGGKFEIASEGAKRGYHRIAIRNLQQL